MKIVILWNNSHRPTKFLFPTKSLFGLWKQVENRLLIFQVEQNIVSKSHPYCIICHNYQNINLMDGWHFPLKPLYCDCFVHMLRADSLSPTPPQHPLSSLEKAVKNATIKLWNTHFMENFAIRCRWKSIGLLHVVASCVDLIRLLAYEWMYMLPWIHEVLLTVVILTSSKCITFLSLLPWEHWHRIVFTMLYIKTSRLSLTGGRSTQKRDS